MALALAGSQEFPASPSVSTGIAAGSFPPGLPALSKPCRRASRIRVSACDRKIRDRQHPTCNLVSCRSGPVPLVEVLRLMSRLPFRGSGNKKPFLAGPGRVRSSRSMREVRSPDPSLSSQGGRGVQIPFTRREPESPMAAHARIDARGGGGQLCDVLLPCHRSVSWSLWLGSPRPIREAPCYNLHWFN